MKFLNIYSRITNNIITIETTANQEKKMFITTFPIYDNLLPNILQLSTERENIHGVMLTDVASSSKRVIPSIPLSSFLGNRLSAWCKYSSYLASLMAKYKYKHNN